ncbi:MAG TPA: hypothetical protein VHK01_14255 [Lacipirellulaceae bacterium]|nr:hypothetical protein [Lacipirellulaceae bacterium]
MPRPIPSSIGKIRAASLGALAVLVSVSLTDAPRADVIVLANRTSSPLTVRFMPLAGQAEQVAMPPGEVTPMFVDGAARVAFGPAAGQRPLLLDPNCAYYFGRKRDGQIGLQKIGLGEDETTAGGRSLPGSVSRTATTTIPVMILVDEEEPGRQMLWERRLRRRVEAASAILEKYCRVSLRVVAVGTWNSDNATNDFNASLAEFEREVKPFPARLAIGFTSQWEVVRGRIHMAGTRGPLHSHILVREANPQIREAERLEFLLHELGHYLGAAHSPERDSVMRPVLGDKQAGRSAFRIGFDPVNALVIAIVGEEMRRGNVTRLADLSNETKRRLRQIYTELARSLPNDPAGQHYVQLMGTTTVATPLTDAARHVLQEIVRAAVSNKARPVESGGTSTPIARLVGDDLTTYYVRRAAGAADKLPDDVAPRAFLVALGIGLDRSDLLAKLPGSNSLAQAIEPVSERTIRLNMIGEPAMRGRQDAVEHFFVSAYLAATMGGDAARAAGIAKELVDAHGGSGFSFADIAADRAGVRFAEGVLHNQLKLSTVAQGYSVNTFMPAIDNLPEGLTAVEVAKRFGTQKDARFLKELRAIDQRIQLLPPYRALNSANAFGGP